MNEQVDTALLRTGKIIIPGQVQTVRPEWIKRDWYPCDVATMIAGRGGELKSTLVLADVAAGTRGELRGRNHGAPVRSLIVATEDSLSVQKARLRAAGVVEEHYAFFAIQDIVSGFDVTPMIPGDLTELERVAVEFGADLIVIDPLSSVVRGNLDKGDIIRSAMDPLSGLARRLHIAVVIVHHFRKGGGASQDLTSNSHVIRDAVRSLILVAHDKDTNARVITFDKSNYSTMEGKSLEFTVRSVGMTDDDDLPIFDDEGNPETVPVVDIGGESAMSVEEIVNRQPATTEDRSEQDEASRWLIGYLADQGGEASAAAAVSAAKADGIAERTLRRGRDRAGIISKRIGFGQGAIWSLPQSGTNGTNGSDKGECSYDGGMNDGPNEDPGTNGLTREDNAEGSHSGHSGHSGQAKKNGGPIGDPADPCPNCGLSLTRRAGTQRCAWQHKLAQAEAKKEAGR